jgi:hypothetical protein
MWPSCLCKTASCYLRTISFPCVSRHTTLQMSPKGQVLSEDQEWTAQVWKVCFGWRRKVLSEICIGQCQAWTRHSGSIEVVPMQDHRVRCPGLMGKAPTKNPDILGQTLTTDLAGALTQTPEWIEDAPRTCMNQV